MKTIGLIGGMSWESSAEYYRLINQATKRKLGGHHNAKSVMVTVDFAEVEKLQHQGEWKLLERLLSEAARQVEGAGADCIMLCTNTMHKLAECIEAVVSIPLLHIADATAQAIQQAQLKRVGLLGTRFTMEEDFYHRRLKQYFGIEVLIPGEKEREQIHQIIYDELCHGISKPASRKKYERAIDNLRENNAEGVILGCTEIMLLIDPQKFAFPLFDTTTIHAENAVNWATV